MAEGERLLGNDKTQAEAGIKLYQAQLGMPKNKKLVKLMNETGVKKLMQRTELDYIADRIAVMCAGRLVELAPAAELSRNPLHPYTRALLSALPIPDPVQRLDLRAPLEGKVSDPMQWPPPFQAAGQLLDAVHHGVFH